MNWSQWNPSAWGATRPPGAQAQRPGATGQRPGAAAQWQAVPDAELMQLLQQAALAGLMVGAEAGGQRAPDPAALLRPEPAAPLRPEAAAPVRAEQAPAEPVRRMATMIRRDMKAEATAAAFYRRLLEATPDPALKEYVRHAMEDEIKHYRMLGRVHAHLTGETHEAAPARIQLTTLSAGYKQALDDELEAAEAYRDMYLSLRDQQLRDIYFELMTDEMEHATRFTYILGLLGRTPATEAESD